MKKKIIICLALLVVILLGVTAYIYFNGDKDNTDNTENANNNETISTPKATPSDELSEQDKSIFNANFDMYVGKNVTGTRVKYLIASIKASNEITSVRKVDLVINGEESMDSSKIKEESTYTVTFAYDNKDLICKAIVEEN